ncbi:MAG TPA: hypothetical protein VIV40_22090 [Kofleriaceae bacterium]
MRTIWVAVVCAAIAACGSDGKDKGSSDAAMNGPDAKRFLDAPPTMNEMITITGNASERSAQGGGALAGVKIEAFRNSDETTAIAATTTDGQGNYSLVIPTNGEAIDGFLKATLNQFKTTYLYPPYALGMDFSGATVIMVKPATYDLLFNATSTTPMPGKGLVAMVITDNTNPVAGAVATSTPATPDVHYNEMVGTFVLPTANATSTYTDGIAYLFNLAPGQVTVSATKTGMTFASHAAKAWADELTTTVIVP